jgi:hypothetical protein
MNRTIIFLVFTHCLAAVIGWKLVGGNFKAGREGPAIVREGTLISQGDEGRKFRKSTARRADKSEQFKVAWDSLPDQKLATKERIKVQRRLLAEWAMYDLEGAMRAVLAESWWSGPPPEFLNAKLEGPFASAFAKAFLADPDGSWSLIMSGELGVGASMMRQAWYDTMQHHPLTLAGKLSEVPESESGSVVWLLKRRGNLSDPAMQREVIDTLKNLPESRVSTREIMGFLPKISIEEATARFEAVTDFTTREGEIALYQYGQLHFIGEKFEGLSNYDQEDLQEFNEVIELLPREVKGKFIYGLLAGSFSHETAMGTEARSVDLLNLLVEGGHWKQLEEAQSLTIVSQGYGLSQERRAAWATSLPKRKETVPIFDDSVRSYISKNEEQARDWIEELPQGTWRDRGMLAYSRQLLGRGQRLEESQEIIEQIQDPEVRRAAEEHHALYEKAGKVGKGR